MDVVHQRVIRCITYGISGWNYIYIDKNGFLMLYSLQVETRRD